MSLKNVFIATGAIAIVGGLTTATLVSSCDTVCTEEARTSVIVHIQDQWGAPYEAEAVIYRVDGGDIERAECVDESCTEWIAGMETPGDYAIDAQICGEHVQVTASVGMTADGCHVETAHVYVTAPIDACAATAHISKEGTIVPPKEGTIVPPKEATVIFPAPTCEGPMLPSVILEIVDGDSEVAKPVEADLVTWQIKEIQPITNALCLPAGFFADEGITEWNGLCKMWMLGFEQAGDFDITATVCNKRYQETVRVMHQEDGCHVDTEHVRIVADIEDCPK